MHIRLVTGSDDSSMPIRMHRTLFQQTNIDELNKSINRKIVQHAYNNTFIQNMGICHTAIINKDINNAISLQCQEMDQLYLG